MTKEQEKAIKRANEIIKNSFDSEDDIELILKKLLNLIQQLQEENKQKDKRVNKILSRLNNDIKNINKTITKKKAERYGYIDDYTKCRLKAYKTKTKEIKEYVEEVYFKKKAGEE